MAELVELLVSAIRESLSDLADAENAGLGGFALVTDASMQTIYGAYVLRSSLDEDEGLVFMPMDWPGECHSASFDRASECLERVSRSRAAAGYDERVRAVADCFVAALQRARSSLTLLDGAFLTAVCADGGGVWPAVERAMVRQLNSPATYSVYERWASEFER